MNHPEHWTSPSRTAPQPVSAVANVDVEQGVLGALLLSTTGDRAHWAGKLVPEDFANELHARIFEAAKAMIGRGQLPTPMLLKAHFEGEPIGGIPVTEYLSRLAGNAAAPSALPGYVIALREMHARRDLLAIGAQATALASNPATDVAGSAAALITDLDKVRATLRVRPSTLTNMTDAPTFIAEFKRPKDMIRTGLASLDETLGGWHRQEFTIVAARPSMGKSAFLFSTLLQAAKRGTTSVIFSLEMPTKAVMARMMSDLVWNTQTPIPYVGLMTGRVPDYDFDRIEEAARKYGQLPLYIDDQAGLTASEIHARAQQIIEKLDRAGRRVDVIAVDHLGKVRASDRYAGNKVQETGEISAAFAVMAKDLDVAVVAAHQLNRGVESRENKRPGMADLRDSGSIEQDAETVMFLYRPAYYLERTKENSVSAEDERKAQLAECQNTLEAIIAKNRNGPVRTLEFFVDLPSNAIRDMSRRAA